MDVSKDYLKAVEVAERIYDKFEEELGTTIFREIHKKLFGRAYNLRGPEDLRKFVKSGS